MKNYFLLLLSVILLSASCQNTIKDEAVTDKENPAENVSDVEEPIHYTINDNKTVREIEDVFGYWVGWFLPDEDDNKYENDVFVGDGFYWARENKITISIDTIRNDSVIGHSIVAGNFRPFAGKFNDEGHSFSFTATEPGDDKYDGQFSFYIEKNADTIKGTWAAFKKIQTPKRKYSLTKRTFEYKPERELRNNFVDWLKTKTRKHDWGDGYIDEIESYFTTTEKVTQLNPSKELLTEDEVSALTKADVYVLRNSIYAKHGYSFKKRQLRVYFDSHEWYMPVHVNIKNELTDLEKQNIMLLLRYEKFAEEFYDEFGR